MMPLPEKSEKTGPKVGLGAWLEFVGTVAEWVWNFVELLSQVIGWLVTWLFEVLFF